MDAQRLERKDCRWSNLFSHYWSCSHSFSRCSVFRLKNLISFLLLSTCLSKYGHFPINGFKSSRKCLSEAKMCYPREADFAAFWTLDGWAGRCATACWFIKCLLFASLTPATHFPCGCLFINVRTEAKTLFAVARLLWTDCLTIVAKWFCSQLEAASGFCSRNYYPLLIFLSFD